LGFNSLKREVLHWTIPLFHSVRLRSGNGSVV
jgi:hypothetical protein